MPKFDLDTIAPDNRTGYPPPHDAPVAGRWYRRIAPAFGFGALGASYVTLEPGAWSGQRHWHAEEDELVVMVAGSAVLIESGAGEEPTRTLVRAGDVCGWAGGDRISHHLVNESDVPCVFVAVSGGNAKGTCSYPDIDMHFDGGQFVHKDGTPFPPKP